MLSRMTYRKKSVSLFISIKYLHMQDLKRNRYRLNVIFWTIDNRSRAQSHFMNCEWIHFIEHSINCLVFVCWRDVMALIGRLKYICCETYSDKSSPKIYVSRTSSRFSLD